MMYENISQGYLREISEGITPFAEATEFPFLMVCDSIQTGILLLNPGSDSAISANRYFLSLLPAHQRKIISRISEKYREMLADATGRLINERMELWDSEKKSAYEFTIYPVQRDFGVVIVSEIASKTISQQSRQGNAFFDKFSEMVAEIAHEIGNPLTGMSTMLQVLQLNINTWPTEKVEDYIQRCISEINRLNGFLNRIRNISREKKLDLQPVRLEKLIKCVFERNRERFERRRIRFDCRVGQNIWVHVDEGALFQILLNLVNNSLNFLKARQTVVVEVVGMDEDFVSLVFRNNGPSIPEEDLDRIFSPFYTTRDQGEGIGLAISLKLITRMGGIMKATIPKKNTGARFVMHIPRASDE